MGIDVGGTFTDVAIYDEEIGDISNYKVLTTPDNPMIGVILSLIHI